MKKYNDKPNIVGNLVRQAREEKKLTKTDLCRKLELLGIEFDRNEIYRIEHLKMSVKDFELIALATVLDIDLNSIKNLITDNWK